MLTMFADLNPLIVLLAVATIGMTLPAAADAAPRTHGILGKKAPELTVSNWTGADGEKIESPRLEDYKGKVVYIYCFQSWCPGCHSSGFPALAKLSETFEDDDGIVFLAVQTVFEGHAANTAQKIPGIRKKYGLTVPIGHDPGTEQNGGISTLMRSYRTGGTPWTILIDPVGNVIFNDFHIDADRAIPVIRGLLDKTKSDL